MRFSSLLFSLALLGSAPSAGAQLLLQGRVLDDRTNEPIAAVTVSLRDGEGRRLSQRITNAGGEFRFNVSSSAPLLIEAVRIGYRRAISAPIQIDRYDSLAIEIRLDVEAVLLAPVEVVSRSRRDVSPTLSRYMDRRVSSLNWSVGRDEIAKQGVSRVSDLLATAPGVAIHRRVVYMGRAENCPAQIYIDGFHINRPVGAVPGRRAQATSELFPIDDLVHPSAVEGIEVFQGISRVPAEFLSPGAVCGVVAIWTRRGS